MEAVPGALSGDGAIFGEASLGEGLDLRVEANHLRANAGRYLRAFPGEADRWVLAGIAVDYRAEIEAQVIDPCYLAVIRRETLGIDAAQMLPLVKLMQKPLVQESIAVLLPIINGLDVKGRETVCAASLRTCLEGAGKC